MRSKMFLAAAAMVLYGAGAPPAHAAEPAHTSIVVEDMCCQSCARKVAGKLYAIKGVKEVRADLKTKTVFVLPQRQVALSPRALWEAVQAAEQRPLRLAGPSGTFTEKPKF